MGMVCIAVKAQRLPLDTYTPNNGLADNRITKVFQDSRGRMFILTREGFSIFDGQRFENYHKISGIDAELCNDIIENEDHSVNIYNFNGDIITCTNEGVRADSSYRKLLTEFTKIVRIGPDEYLVVTNYSLYRRKKNTYTKLDIRLPNAPYLYLEQMAVYKNFIVFNRWTSPVNKQIFLYDFKEQKIKDILNATGNGQIIGEDGGSIYIRDREWLQLDMTALENGHLKTKPAWFRQWIPTGFDALALYFDDEGNAWLINSSSGCCRISRSTGERKMYEV